MSSDEQPDLFTRLLHLAVGSFDKRAPTAVLPSMPLPFPGAEATVWEGWANAVITESNAFVAGLHERLRSGPVFTVLFDPLVTPGARRAAEPDRRPDRPAYELLDECEPFDDKSTIAALLSPSALSSSRSDRWREALGQHWHIPFVIYGPTYFGRECAAIVLRASKGQPARPTRIYRIPSDAAPDTIIADFRSLLTMKGGQRATNGYVSRRPILPRDGYAFPRHDPALERRHQALADFDQVVPLTGICQVLLGINFHPKPNPHERPEPGSVRLLSGRDMMRDGTIAPPDEYSRWAQPPVEFQLCAGDILVPSIFRSVEGQGLVLAQVTQNDLPATVSNSSVFVLRPRETATEMQVMLLLMFLRTPLAKDQAVASSFRGDFVRISDRALRELRVPQPDDALVAAIDDMRSAAQKLHDWQSEATALLNNVFRGEPRGARARLIESGRRLRMRTDAAAQIDDFSHAVRSRYPYPIALRWRHVEASIGSDAAEISYKKVLRTAEVVACYTALLGIVAAREAGIELGTLIRFPERLQVGISFGDWLHVLHEVGNKLKRLPDDAPLAQVRSLLTDHSVANAMERLREGRNDDSHGREDDLNALLGEAYEDLCTVIAGAEFLCDLKLVLVTDVSYDSLARVSTVRYQEMMGDHSVVRTQTMRYEDPHVEKDSLYLRDDRGGLHLLRPFLIGRRCEKCSQWGTFHVDKAPKGTDDIVIRSLDHGHSRKVAGLREPLRHVGLL